MGGQKVHSPSKAGRGVAFLILARAKRGRWLVLGEFAKYAFFWPDKEKSCFERSVLKYVSIKNRILTPSGQKRRVCVNAADGLLPPEQRTNSFAFLQLSPTQPQVAKANRPSATHSLSTAAIKSRSWSSLPYTRQSAARAMAGVGRICKIRIFLA